MGKTSSYKSNTKSGGTIREAPSIVFPVSLAGKEPKPKTPRQQEPQKEKNVGNLEIRRKKESGKLGRK